LDAVIDATTFEISGSKLAIKTAPLISSQTGKQVGSILMFERAD